MRMVPLLVLTTVVVLDQLSKYIVSLLLSNDKELKLIGDYLKLTLVHNEGSAFGFKILSRGGYVIVSVILIAFLVRLMYRTSQHGVSLESIGYAMLAGGAIGNLLDRLFRGAVVDFISIGKFPVFNIADTFITLGLGCVLIATMLPAN